MNERRLLLLTFTRTEVNDFMRRTCIIFLFKGQNLFNSFMHLSSSIRRSTTVSFHPSLSSVALLILHTLSFPSISAYPESMYLLVCPVSLFPPRAPLECVRTINRSILLIDH